ncbi:MULTISPECIES: four helix bundle protein [Flavobacterium]|uniref:Four helix bundle protein n=2 Tax=Flavobacterium TaxID=237 RepID=A0A2N9P8P7_9FLAO|nr:MULTISPECIES: four helix bundle protein [Flavobacterium]AMO20316.1 four helix bundle protein [Flavobacterium columnare]AUX18274.1 four helix bundle protein [Flavobacterium columnare]MEB3801211.1 four helix bundle protein [Flavobacterium columnare]QOG57352.1 four helix bundle protein [Flavobacterium columnare]QOG60076.1 four helix bundle protein [Flavobacterium columnare]
MSGVNTYKELIIWQKGIRLVVLVYKLTEKFPRDEIYALTSQIKRASVSIPSNIAEGFGRRTDKSFGHFLNISRGSLNELETQIFIAKELNFITDEILFEEVISLIEEESKMLNAFSKSLKEL